MGYIRQSMGYIRQSMDCPNLLFPTTYMSPSSQAIKVSASVISFQVEAVLDAVVE